MGAGAPLGQGGGRGSGRVKMKASLFDKSSLSAALHAEHVKCPPPPNTANLPQFSRLLDINDDSAPSSPAGSPELLLSCR